MASDTDPGKSSDTLLPRPLPPLGHFRLLRELGRGGMGVVYEAHDTRAERSVALKILNVPADLDPREAKPAEDRFLREARLVAAIPPHPGIVAVLEAGAVDGRRYIAMELVHGVPLGEWRRQSSLTLPKHVAMIRDVALAAHHAHESGVVHRDLKPENILVERDTRARITDFGLAKDMGHARGASIPISGTPVGTPDYMSPEQIQGKKNVDRRADVYSLGVMLYEVLAGRKPFVGGSSFEVMSQAVREDAPTPSRLSRVHFNPVLFKRLEAICLTALARDPDDRYPTAQAFAEDLTKWLRGDDFQVALPRTLRAARVKQIARQVTLASATALLLSAVLVLLYRRTPAAPPLPAGAVAEVYSGTNFNALGVRRVDTRAVFENRATPLWAEAPGFWVSFRWDGVLEVPKSGACVFETRSKEGVRLLVDGAPVISNWGFHPPATDQGEATLEAGRHRLTLEYYHTSEEELLRLSWKHPGAASMIPITPGMLRHDPATFAPREPPRPEENGPRSVPNAQEGTSLPVLETTGSPVVLKSYDSHRLFWRGTRSADAHLWWGERVKPGDRLRLGFTSGEAGRKTLVLALTHASDHGVFKVRVNGVEIATALDLYDADLRVGESEFRDVDLRAGANELEFEVSGSHPQAREWGPGTGLYKLGLDHLLVR